MQTFLKNREYLQKKTLGKAVSVLCSLPPHTLSHTHTRTHYWRENLGHDLPVEWVSQPAGLLAHSSQLPLCKHLSLWGWQTSDHLLTGRQSCPSSLWPHGSRWWRWGWPSPGAAAAGRSAHPSSRSSCRQGQLASAHRWNPFNKGGLLCFFRGCQLIVQGAGQGVPTKCPKFLTCFFHCKLRQGGLSGNPNAFNKTRWSLLTTLARLMCFSNPANGNRGWRKVRERPKGLCGYSKDPDQQSNLSTSLSF